MSLTINDYNLKLSYQVHWGDMDSAKHVNNLVYLKWAESGRIEYFREMGMDTSFANKVGPILGWQDCKYIFPITYPDEVLVGVKVSDILEDRFMMECAVFSKRHDRICALSMQAIIPYDYIELKKAKIPDRWLNSIERIEKGGG